MQDTKKIPRPRASEGKVLLQVAVPPHLYRRCKVVAAMRGVRVSRVVEDLVEANLPAVEVQHV